MTNPEGARVAESVSVIDVAPARIRQPLDLVRLASLLVALVVLAGLGSFASGTGRGASEDFARLVRETPNVFIRLFSVLGTLGALAVPLGLMVTEIARGHSRRLVEALITGLVAIGLIEGLDWALSSFPSSALLGALTGGGTVSALRPLDAYLAALLAFVTVIGVSGDPLWRRLMVALTVVYVGSVFAGTRAPLLSPLFSVTIGAMVGVLVCYIVGRVNEQPDGFRIAAELGRRGFPLTRLERIHDRDQDHRTYLATARTGELLTVHVLDRDLIASGALHTVYRLVRVRAEIAPTPALSLERVAERRSLLAMATTAAGAAIPRLVAGVPCGSDTIVLAYQSVHGTTMLAPTDDQLNELWNSVTRLHAHRITHRGLVAGKILIGPDGQVLLPIPTDGTAFATELRISLDRAQLLTTCAQLAGAERAVRSARTVLTDDELAATLSVLQPIALNRETRDAIGRDAGLLEGLRHEIQSQIDREMPDLAHVERVRPRTIISIVALLVAVYLIVGEVSTVNLGSVFALAHWQWIPLVLLASAATHLAAALSLIGYVRERLSFPRTVLAQLAGAFAGFVTPPSVGGIAVNVLYLRKANVSTTGAATSVVTAQVVNAASHGGLLVVFAAATGASSPSSLPVPAWAFTALGTAAALFAVALTIPGVRRALSSRLLPPLREALPRLLNLLTSPTKLVEAALGTLLLNTCFIGALWFATLAFDGHLGIVSVAVVYLAGAAIGSLAPTPGGLGAIEIALSTGLAAASMPSAAAISAVLLYRLTTFWLPIPIGWAALHWLQQHDAL
jgi:uncharacterized protein (TIRG00374 family)